MQHKWKQQINLDKVVKPAQKTKETLNLKREVRGEPVKPKKNAQCWGSRLPSGQVASRKGRSPIRIGTSKTGYFLKEIAKNWGKKRKKSNKKKFKKKKQKNAKKKQNKWALGRVIPWEMAPPTCPKSSVWDLGWGAVPTTRPFPENLCAHSSVDAGAETQTELKLILAHIACEANSRTGMHENQATETAYPARPLYKCESSGCPKTFSAFAILYLQSSCTFLIFICFALRFCICIVCAFMFSFLVDCSFCSCFLFTFLRSIFFKHHMLHFFKIPIF